MTTKSQFRIFNICAFDKNLCTWVLDLYLNDQDRAIAQATAIAKGNAALHVYIKAHKSRKDQMGEIVWSCCNAEIEFPS